MADTELQLRETIIDKCRMDETPPGLNQGQPPATISSGALWQHQC